MEQLVKSNRHLNIKDIKELFFKILFLACAIFSVVAVLAIIIFIFARSFPTIFDIGFFRFVFGNEWNPNEGNYGVLPMVVGSLYVTAGAIVIGMLFGLFTGVFIAVFAHKKVKKPAKQIVSLLAGIPSVVFGLFGIVFILPIMVDISPTGYPFGTLAGSLVLGMMILPTIVALSATSIEAVPQSYYEGALALGATHEQAAFKVVVPAARSGIVASIILGIGRALGETMAVRMVLSNNSTMPTTFWGLFDSFSTLTTHIVNGLAESGGSDADVLIATGAVLFIFILLLNICLRLLTRERKLTRGKKS